MKKIVLIVFGFLLSFSVILNIVLFFQMHHLKNNEILYSYDNGFYSTISSNKYNCNIQIVKNDSSTRYTYCDPTIYSAWLKQTCYGVKKVMIFMSFHLILG